MRSNKATVLAFLSDIGNGSLPILEGKTTKSTTRYIAGVGSEVTAKSGVVLEAGTKKEVGITNFETGDVLPAGVHFLVTEARILFDTTADVTPKTAVWKGTAPAPWMNGELIVSQDGAGRLFETSISDLTNSKASASNDDDFREIIPFMLRPEINFSIQANLAGAGGNEAYKVEFRGILFKDASKN